MYYFISFPVNNRSTALHLHTYLRSHALQFTKLQVPLSNWSSFGGMIELGEKLIGLSKNTTSLISKMSQFDKKNPSFFRNFSVQNHFKNFLWPERFESLNLADLYNLFEDEMKMLRKNFDKRMDSYEKKRKDMEKLKKRENGKLVDRCLWDIVSECHYEIDRHLNIRNFIDSDEEQMKDNIPNNLKLDTKEIVSDSTENNTKNMISFKNSEQIGQFTDSDMIKVTQENQNSNKYEFLEDFFIVKNKKDEKNVDNLIQVNIIKEEDEMELVHYLGLVGKKEEIEKQIKEKNWILKDLDVQKIDYKEYHNTFTIYEKNFYTFIDTYLLETIGLFFCIKLTKLYVDSVLRYGLPASYVFLGFEEKNDDVFHKKWMKAIKNFDFGRETHEDGIAWENLEGIYGESR